MFLPLSAKLAPSFEKRTAVAAPIPELAPIFQQDEGKNNSEKKEQNSSFYSPVMRATFPWSFAIAWAIRFFEIGSFSKQRVVEGIKGLERETAISN